MRARREREADRAGGRSGPLIRSGREDPAVQRVQRAVRAGGDPPLTPGQALALQRAAGNAATAGFIEGPMQRAPAEDTGQQPAQPSWSIAANPGANPWLYSDFQGHYWVGPYGQEPDGYIEIEQHCAYLATHWLLTGHGAGGLRYADLDEAARIRASDTVRQWASAGGRDAQTEHARAHLGGHEVTRQNLTSDATANTLPVGTRIWFGTDRHAEAAVVVDKNVFLMYDPNTGRATRRSGKDFAAYIANKNAFVVALGPDPDPESCKCCAVM
ncbi:hypothetical protein [Streptomyces sp. NPDC002851]